MNIYREIRPKKIADQVFEQIQDLIYKGQLKAGEKLLPERELAETLNVSRNSVREAINKLIERKLIENRQGMADRDRRTDERLLPSRGVIFRTIRAVGILACSHGTTS